MMTLVDAFVATSAWKPKLFEPHFQVSPNVPFFLKLSSAINQTELHFDREC
jgi:hypothetical protein